jgi:hypothetical protein
MRRQKAVYWPPAEPSFDRYGHPTTTVAPCEVCCRWQEKLEEEITIDATVYRRIARVHPDKEVLRGGYMFLGPITDLVSVTDPKANGAREIISVESVPNLKNRQTLHIVMVGDG